MRSLMRRDLHEDQGSIILALLGIVILTTVASVGLADVINGQTQTRHDNTFAQSLDNASSGLDAMVSYIKNNPAAGLTGLTETLPSSTTYKNVTAKPTLTIDTTGNPASTTWNLSATGIATVQGRSVYRTIDERVTIAHTYRTPVYGAQGLQLGQGSSINDYDPTATASSTTDSLSNTILPGLTTTVPIPNNGTPGAATVGSCPSEIGRASCRERV